MSEYNYQLNCGQYVLHCGDKPVGAVQDEIAIAFDRDSGTLHKHGSPAMVQEWTSRTQKKLRDGGMTEMADDLVIICGKFPLEELNRCIGNTGYILTMVDKLQRGLIAQEPATLPPPPR